MRPATSLRPAFGPAFAEATARQAAVAARSPSNAEEFDRLFHQVKNWGRWGADDQLGSVNLITPAKRKQALSLAKTGQTVSLVHNPLTDKSEDNASPFEHTMNPGFTTDTYRVSYHGYSHSHMDAFCQTRGSISRIFVRPGARQSSRTSSARRGRPRAASGPAACRAGGTAEAAKFRRVPALSRATPRAARAA